MTDHIQVISHEALCPVRVDVVGEVVMVSKWRVIVGPEGLTWEESHRSLLSRILTCEMTPRAFQVAASTIRWTGTNRGRAFLHEAKELMASAGENAYLFAWAKANKRESGTRLIEHIVARPSDFSRMAGFPALGWSRPLRFPQLTMKSSTA